jgi:hypothetical protein
MIGRLLCRLGLHGRLHYGTFIFASFRECSRCEKRWWL